MAETDSTYAAISAHARTTEAQIKRLAAKMADCDAVGSCREVRCGGDARRLVPEAWFVLAQACGRSDDWVLSIVKGAGE